MIAVVSPSSDVDVGPRERRHEALHERAVGLVDQPLRLGGDRAEDQRALARARDAGEHRQPALGDLDADVLEVVHPRAVHADEVVAVGSVRRGRVVVVPWSAQLLDADAGCRRGRGRRSRGCRTAARSAPGRPRRAGLQPLEGAVEVRRGEVDARVGALGHHLGDRAALVVGDAGVGGRRVQDDRRARAGRAGRR